MTRIYISFTILKSLSFIFLAFRLWRMYDNYRKAHPTPNVLCRGIQTVQESNKPMGDSTARVGQTRPDQMLGSKMVLLVSPWSELDLWLSKSSPLQGPVTIFSKSKKINLSINLFIFEKQIQWNKLIPSLY